MTESANGGFPDSSRPDAFAAKAATRNEPGTENRDAHATLENTAGSAGIPEEAWGNPIVREYVNLLNRVENLGIDLALAKAKRGQSAAAVGEAEQLSETPVDPETLGVRYEAAQLLLAGAQLILKDAGANKPTDPANYLKEKVGGVLGRYGLNVVPAEPQGLPAPSGNTAPRPRPETYLRRIK